MNNKSLNKLNNWLNRIDYVSFRSIELGYRIDRLTRPARSIFESPTVFKWEALQMSRGQYYRYNSHSLCMRIVQRTYYPMGF